MIKLEEIYTKVNSYFGGSLLKQDKKKLENEFFTITDLLPYRFFDDESEIFINDNSYGFVLESSPLVGADESTINTLQGIFSDSMPKGCTIQFLTYSSPKIGKIFDSWQENRNKVGGIYKKLAQKRVEFFKDSNHRSLFDSSPFTLKDFRLIISVSMSGEKQSFIQKITTSQNKDSCDVEILKNLKSFKQRLIKVLQTANIHSLSMSPEELISFLRDIINPNFDLNNDVVEYDELQPINKQIVSPNNHLKVEPDQISLFANDKEKRFDLRCFSVRSYPSSWANWQSKDLIGDYFQDLRRMEYPFITCFSVTSPYNEDSLVTKAKQKNFNATRLADSEMSKFLPEMKTSAKEWQFVNEKVSSGQKLLKTSYQIVIIAPPEKINESESSIKSIYKSKGWDIIKDKYVNLPTFLSILPFTHSEGLFDDLEKINRTRVMVSWTCANLVPVQGEWRGMNSPCMMLYGRRGQPFFFNPFKNEEGNYNMAVIGKSGSGKSVFMQEMVASILGFGGKVYVIDDGRSFMNSCFLQKGEFVEFSDKSQIVLNPFSIVNKEVMSKNPEYKAEVIKLIKSMVRQMCEGEKREGDHSAQISQIQDRYIEEAVQNAWNKFGQEASISDICDFFLSHKDNRANDLSVLIRPFTKDGIYGRFFEGQSTIKLDNSFMVFELAELKNKKEFQAIVLMFLMFLVSENMYFGDRKTPISLLIDEAWDLLHGEGSKSFIEGLSRRARKYCGNIITGTQSVNDYYKNSATIAAFENTDWVILLAQKKESIERLAKSKKIVMDDNLKKVLMSLKMVDHQYSEALIYGPSGYAVGRLILDPFSIALYSSKAQDFAIIEEYKKKGYELEDILDIIASQKSQGKEEKFFDYQDYRKILGFVDDDKTFEDSLELVVKEKFYQRFPQIAQEFYQENQKNVK